MEPIRLLYVKNVIARQKENAQQHLTFAMLVENLAYEKLVEVCWTGEDGCWKALPAHYVCPVGQNREIWQAQTAIQAFSDDDALPGDIQFALHYRVAGKNYWDNNHGQNHAINADSGVRLADGLALLNVDAQPALQPGQQFYPVTAAIRHDLRPRQVYIHWTTDHWRTARQTPCYFIRKHWDRALGSNARNPNRYGCGIWISHLDIGDAFRVEYAVAGVTPDHTLWDNNFTANYVARHERLKILTLNLHCYQEEDQEAKFDQIARAINDLDIDLVCFQEVGELWNEGKGDWNSNAAKIIRDRLRQPYHLHADWSHRGFERYREGSAILSRYPFVSKEAGHVSATQEADSIHTRKIVAAQVHVPGMGLVNIFCTHLSWWEDGFAEQWEKLSRWAAQKQKHNVAATFLCGDFNVPAGSKGYLLAAQEYEDQLSQTPSPDPGLDLNGRIDYIFMKKRCALAAVNARVLFDGSAYGRVSDHYGYYAEFEPK